MAKIISVELQSVPKVINVGDSINDITVLTSIEFHPLDISLKMEYCVHLFVYDIHGDIDAPMILPNWNESKIISISLDRKDDFLGEAVSLIHATKESVVVKTPMALKLGSLAKGSSHYSRKLEVFATMAPAVGRASKWSERFEARIER
jgi:flagellar motor component MotA